MEGISVKTLFEENKTLLKLKPINGGRGFDKIITQKDLNRPGLALSGFVDVFTYDRVQILGNTEISYLETLSPLEKEKTLRKVLAFDIPCMIITNNNNPPKELINIANEKGISLFKTPFSTTKLTRLLGDYLEEKFAPRITIHGTLVDVYGIGLLFTGRSGIGKSEIALDLVERGHRLVADDMVTITRRAGGILIGSSNELLKHHIEIRGLGIIDVRSIFGIRAIRLQKRIEVEVLLKEWDDSEDYERIGLDEEYREILGVKIPLVKLPIFPGKNITVIAEVIALNQLLKIYGYHPAKEFNRKLLETIQRKTHLRAYLEHDFE